MISTIIAYALIVIWFLAALGCAIWSIIHNENY